MESGARDGRDITQQPPIIFISNCLTSLPWLFAAPHSPLSAKSAPSATFYPPIAVCGHVQWARFWYFEATGVGWCLMSWIDLSNFDIDISTHCSPNRSSSVSTSECRDGQQTLISCTSFQILHLQLAVLFQTKSPMSTFSVSGDRILSHIMPRSADDDTVQLITRLSTHQWQRFCWLRQNM